MSWQDTTLLSVAEGLRMAPVTVLADGDAQSKVRQGVTLDVIGQSNSVGPVEGPAAGE